MSGRLLLLHEPEAFQRLYTGTHLQLFRYVYSLLGGPAQEAEDLTAETYIRAWRNRRSFSGDEQMAAAWLFRIARNLVVDAYRRDRVRGLSTQLDEDLPDQPALSPEERYIHQEQFKEVWELLSRLPLEQREMIVLRYLLNWPVKDIAEHQQTSENHVSVNIRRVLARLKKQSLVEQKE